MARPPLAAASSQSKSTGAATATATAVSSLSDDDLREIFLRLPDLPALVRAALTCRPWLRAARSSRPFRRLFRALHPAPLIGLFLKIGSGGLPSFLPLPRPGPVVAAALRRGDFFLTSLPPSRKGWSLADCRDGYVLLWNGSQKRPSIAALNPMTWAIDVLPHLPGSRRDVTVLGFHLLSSEESPRSFRVACVCADRRKVRAAVFSSETSEWAIGPWARVRGDRSLKLMSGTLVGGSVFWPCHGEARMVRIDAATMDVSFLDLPPLVEKVGHDFGVGETKNGELCAFYASDYILHAWIRRRGVGGTEIWAPQPSFSLGGELYQLTRTSDLDVELDLKIVRVRPGLVHLSTTCVTRAGALRCWLFSLSLEAWMLELLLHGSFDGTAHLYNMAWPPSLVGDHDDVGQ